MAAITGFFHGGITVRDMDASLRFYRDGSGSSRSSTGSWTGRTSTSSWASTTTASGPCTCASRVAASWSSSSTGASSACRPRPPCDYGSGHLCLYVDDVEEMHARLVSLGFHARSEQVVDITAGPNAGARSCYMADPDGYAVELFQKRPGA